MVAPLVGAWIETHLTYGTRIKKRVAPLVGAWIETTSMFLPHSISRSLPSWERGLKLAEADACKPWIQSLPSWERGLKLLIVVATTVTDLVAPLVGAWIETDKLPHLIDRALRRSPRGSVD